MQKNKFAIKVDKTTYYTIVKVLFHGYLLTHKDVSRIGYTKEQFKQLDEKYKNKQEYYFDNVDLPVIIKGLEWMMGVQDGIDDSVLLDINRQQGFKLLDLLKESKSEIKSKDWYEIENLPIFLS